MDVALRFHEIGGSGGRLSTLLYTVATNTTRVDKELTDIAGDVALTSTALNDVGRFFEDRAAAKLASEDAYRDAQSILQRCQDSFVEVQTLSGEYPLPIQERAIKTRASVPFRGVKLELLKKRLEGLKTSLILLLSVLNFGRKYGSRFVDLCCILLLLTLPRPRDEPEVQQQFQACQQLYHRHRSVLSEVKQLELRLESTTLQETPGSEPSKRVKREQTDFIIAAVPEPPAWLVPPVFPDQCKDVRNQLKSLIFHSKSFLSNIEHALALCEDGYASREPAYADTKARASAEWYSGVLTRYLCTHVSDSYAAKAAQESAKDERFESKPSECAFSNEAPVNEEHFDFDSFTHGIDDAKSFTDLDFTETGFEEDVPSARTSGHGLEVAGAQVAPANSRNSSSISYECDSCKAKRLIVSSQDPQSMMSY